MLRPSPNHGTQRLPNDDDDDEDFRLDVLAPSVFRYPLYTQVWTPGILLVGVQLPFQVIYGSLKRVYDYDLSLLVG